MTICLWEMCRIIYILSQRLCKESGSQENYCMFIRSDVAVWSHHWQKERTTVRKRQWDAVVRASCRVTDIASVVSHSFSSCLEVGFLLGWYFQPWRRTWVGTVGWTIRVTLTNKTAVHVPPRAHCQCWLKPLRHSGFADTKKWQMKSVSIEKLFVWVILGGLR